LIDTLFFYLFAALALGGAIFTVTRRSPVHSAVSLIVSLLGVAGLYLLQRAEFLFAAQIILYVGGVMVLFLFVIMLVNLEEAARERQFNGQLWLALASIAGIAVAAFYLIGKAAAEWGKPQPAATLAGSNVERLSDVLFHEYLLPFELVSVLLLAAMVGAVLMARKPA